jgi:predicted nuclease of restriction endonuclease-like (RecB) superfamily
MAKRRQATDLTRTPRTEYDGLVSSISDLLEHARRTAARSLNSILTATYWEVGRRIVEFEQGGKARASYGEDLLERLGNDLSRQCGRGFSRQSLQRMRTFYLGWAFVATPSGKVQARVKCSTVLSISVGDTAGTAAVEAQPSIPQQLAADSAAPLADAFPLPWSHYIRLMSVRDEFARWFYEDEAIRGAWSVRQLDRQISTQFYERTALSRNKEAMLRKGQQPKPEDAVPVEEMIRDPYLLEFLDLKDQYSEADLEEALIQHLETFLLEMGAGFAFVARQKRIRVGDEWYRIDLLLFHRRLKCLVVIDLKIGKFSHADAGQMNLYLNYAREHLMEPDENEPAGLILCSQKNDAVVHYAMGGIQAKVFASQYLTVLPDTETLRRQILETKHALETRAAMRRRHPE